MKFIPCVDGPLLGTVIDLPAQKLAVVLRIPQGYRVHVVQGNSLPPHVPKRWRRDVRYVGFYTKQTTLEGVEAAWFAKPEPDPDLTTLDGSTWGPLNWIPKNDRPLLPDKPDWMLSDFDIRRIDGEDDDPADNWKR